MRSKPRFPGSAALLRSQVSLKRNCTETRIPALADARALLDFSSENAKGVKKAIKGGMGKENSQVRGMEWEVRPAQHPAWGLVAFMLCRHLCLCPCDSLAWWHCPRNSVGSL